MLNESNLTAVQIHHEHTEGYRAPRLLLPLSFMLHMLIETAQTSAILDDLTEDKSLTLADQQQPGFRQENRDSFDTYGTQVVSNLIARRVKKANLGDKMDLRRVNTLSGKALDRLDKYLRPWNCLETCMALSGELDRTHPERSHGNTFPRARQN